MRWPFHNSMPALTMVPSILLLVQSIVTIQLLEVDVVDEARGVGLSASCPSEFNQQEK